MNKNPIPCHENDLIVGYYDPAEDYQLISFATPKTKDEWSDWYASRCWEKVYNKDGKPILPKRDWKKIFHEE